MAINQEGGNHTLVFLKGSQQARLVVPFMQKERDFVNLTHAAIGFSGYLFLCMFTGFVVTD